MQLSDFYYELPPDLIARYPLEKRSASRLLCVDSTKGNITHRQFSDILSFMSPADLLVFNNTRVIAARLLGRKASGGRVEVLIERILDAHRVLAFVRASKSPKVGSILFFSDHCQFEVMGRKNDLFELRCHDEKHILDLLESIGQIPLPPYFQREPEESDKERYQTVYALHKGSVAAPTAGLHFDNELLTHIREKNIAVGFVTLHVGAGTFAPVRVENIQEHRMHAEYFEVSAELCQQVRDTKARGGRVIAVGTTTARSLETVARNNNGITAFTGETNIFIYPGYQFKCVDALITNLHLPCSTLLMLTTAFGGYENIMRAYQIAVQEKYRFFSYGDAMWIAGYE